MDDDKLGKTEAHSIVVRSFEPSDKLEVQRIFYEGMMEMVSDTAFRGLRHHPESLLLYAAFTIGCLVITQCWWVIGLLPVSVLCARYFCSRRVIHAYLDCALQTDMGDVEGFYMKSPDSCLWVAVLEGKVVGLVAAVGHRTQTGTVELQRMSVDQNCRRRGVGMVLGRKVLEYAVTGGYSTVVLGTTAYNSAAHRLYQSLGFSCVGVTNGYTAPGTRQSVLERVFYRVRHHHYSLDVQRTKLKIL
ncbi:N-acetylaspartate synthetase-like isoform X1 [Sphaeramia orbicularis]|uniref:N-acetylaspartate synthetase-like isoform X1 n=1 Tax=Sphaeramia orbicularis TaxID=375764 RepID=UPI001180B3D8|nr:N-acetylaspartate synthetase-like isoform X1 [Sphaeramia orbicularis]